jgi:hypothetical protein
VRIPGVDEAFVVFAGQDSGCLSYGVAARGRRWFVKRPRTEAARASLRRALTFHTAVRHPAIVRPVLVSDEDGGPTLLYPWVEGVVLNEATAAGSDRRNLERFRTRPVSAVVRALKRGVVDRATRRPPEQRYGTVADLAAAWRSATRSLGRRD